MKKRRTMMGMLLLVAVLMLGVGYAAISKTFVINGTATAEVNDANFKVHFDEAYVKGYEASNGDDVVEADPVEGNATLTGTVAYPATVNETATNGLVATLTAGNFKTKGEAVYFTLKMVNKSEDLIANVGAPVITNTGEGAKYFDITVLDPAIQQETALGAVVLQPKNGEKEIWVKVELIKNYIGDTPLTHTFTINMTATAEEATGPQA